MHRRKPLENNLVLRTQVVIVNSVTILSQVLVAKICIQACYRICIEVTHYLYLFFNNEVVCLYS